MRLTLTIGSANPSDCNPFLYKSNHQMTQTGPIGQSPDLTVFLVQKSLADWYRINQRPLPWRSTKDPYHIWVSEVMAQQTQMKTVIPYYLRFTERFPTIRDLAKADLDTVLKLWEGLGYYARARNFHRASRVVADHFQHRIPEDLAEFKTLPGVGEYIGAAVQSIAFGHPEAVVDGNVKRVLARLFRLDFPANGPASHRQFLPFARNLLDKNDPGTFNQAMMELGALICTPKAPVCPQCPVSSYCSSFVQNSVNDYPKRLKPKKVPVVKIAVGIVRKNGKLLITKRKPDGLLGGLWEFPGGKLKNNEVPKAACIREIKEETGLTVEITSHLTTVRHAYTHFKIIMEVFDCTWQSGRVRLNGPVDYCWISPKDINRFAFPKANLKFIPMIL